MWCWQISQDMQRLTDLCHAQQRENDRLQQELYEWRIEDEDRKRLEAEAKRKKDKEEVERPRSASGGPNGVPGVDDLQARGRTPWSTYPARYEGLPIPLQGTTTEGSKSFVWEGRNEGSQMEVMTLLVESVKSLQ